MDEGRIPCCVGKIAMTRKKAPQIFLLTSMLLSALLTPLGRLGADEQSQIPLAHHPESGRFLGDILVGELTLEEAVQLYDVRQNRLVVTA